MSRSPLKSLTKFDPMYRAMRGTRDKYSSGAACVLIDRPSAALFITGRHESFEGDSIEAALHHGFGRRLQNMARDLGLAALHEYLEKNPSDRPILQVGLVRIANLAGVRIYEWGSGRTDMYVKLERLRLHTLEMRDVTVVSLDPAELRNAMRLSRELPDVCRRLRSSVEAELKRVVHAR